MRSLVPRGGRRGFNPLHPGAAWEKLQTMTINKEFSMVISREHNIKHHFPYYTRTSLWSRGNIVASHLAGPGSIPGRVRFPD